MTSRASGGEAVGTRKSGVIGIAGSDRTRDDGRCVGSRSGDGDVVDLASAVVDTDLLLLAFEG